MENEESRSLQWQVAGACVRGASHMRTGLPNQDAVAWLAPASPHHAALLAVADGHGSALHMRSHVGAKLAARTAIEELRRFAAEACDLSPLSLVEKTAAELLPRRLAYAWRNRVETHLARQPLDAQQLQKMADAGLPVQRLHENPAVAYGTTLIAAVIAPTYLLYVQIGDGDVLTLERKQGAIEVARPPLPSDPRLFANQTTSLSSPAAWEDFRVYCQPVTEDAPLLVMLSTDGYANSFAGEADFARVPIDLLPLIERDGLAKTARKLRGWLRLTSIGGSGDDIAVGLAWRAHG